jgi:DNA-binding transcriptional MerR regulator
MEETRYSISEAGKMVGVESHVLRYWQDELRLEIPRNVQGHRYYTDLHIRLFRKVKELKDKGYQLKAIEQVLDRMISGDEGTDPDAELEQQAVMILKEEGVGENMEGETTLRLVAKREETALEENTDKLEQLQQIMNHIIGRAVNVALQENHEAMSAEISRQVNDRMVQELEYMMRINDEREEERFKMLDESLRAWQKENKSSAEAAATKLPFFRKRRFGRNGKKM